MLYYRAWRLLPSVGPVALVTVKTHAAPLIYKHETGQALEDGDRHKAMKRLAQRTVAMPRAEPTFPHNQTTPIPSSPAAAGKTVTGSVSLDIRFPAGSLPACQPSSFMVFF